MNKLMTFGPNNLRLPQFSHCRSLLIVLTF